MFPEVTIIVLNWNGCADTLDCIASLEQLDYPAYEIVVIDNGSTDDSVLAIRTAYPGVTLIETGENLGFTGGNNVGLRYALDRDAEYVFLLNNDTEVEPALLDRLVDAGESDPAFGIVGPTIYYHGEPDCIWSVGGCIDWRRGLTWMEGLNERDVGQFGHKLRTVDFVTGCAMLVRRDVIEKAGVLDERFFAYYEEAEWCVRACRAGFKIVHAPQARLWHKISPVARESSPQVHYYMTRNRLLLLKLAKAGIVPWLYTLLFDYGRTLASWTLKRRWRHKAAQRRAMLQAIFDCGRGRFGKVQVG